MGEVLRWRVTRTLLASAILGVFSWRFFSQRHLEEDAFIAFRYAENLASGLGPVFNVGERVEGYSSFAWVALLAAGRKMGFDIPSVASLLGWLCGAATLLAVHGLARRLAAPSTALIAGWLAPLLLAAWPHFGLWSGSGMETALFSGLLTALLVESVGGASAEASRRQRYAVPILALLLCWTRWEGLYFAGAVLAAFVWRAWQIGSVRPAGRVAFWCFVLPFSGWYALRACYYGHWLPASFSAKYGAAKLDFGLRYLSDFLRGGPGGWILLLATGAAVAGPRIRLWVMALAIGYIGCVTYLGGDIYPYARYLVPIVPLLFALIDAEATMALQVDRPGRRRAAAAACGLAALVAMRPPVLAHERDLREQGIANDRERQAVVPTLASWLAGGGSLALQDAGILPFLLKRPVIDLLGLNDDWIAHVDVPRYDRGTLGHEKHDEAYVLLRSPDHVLFVGHQWQVDVVTPILAPPGPLAFPETMVLLQANLSDLPAQTLLWQEPWFRIRYRPELHAYDGRRIVAYHRDREIEDWLARAGRDRAARFALYDALLAKGCEPEARWLAARFAVFHAALDPALAERVGRISPALRENERRLRRWWIGRHRHQLQGAIGGRDWGAARAIADRLVRFFPLDAEARGGLVDYYLATGRRDLALRQARAVADLTAADQAWEAMVNSPASSRPGVALDPPRR